ncbi:ORFL126C [Human betaherpesvirus 5]|nr:ORFL126C [Human betaherpesvirus 5]QHX40447.1 ORFL126C [Human betaherpesvirus 5]
MRTFCVSTVIGGEAKLVLAAPGATATSSSRHSGVSPNRFS